MPSPEKPAGPEVASRIRSLLQEPARGMRVSDVRVGLGYTAVLLADGRAGLAYTFRDDVPRGCSVLTGILPLRGRPAVDLLALLESRNPVEAGVGLACANALANRDRTGYLEGDILDHLELRADDDVGMVGCFGPLMETIRGRALSLTVFERLDRPSPPLRPEAEAGGFLPRCRVALITATSIINHAVEGLLEAARGCREVVLLGASTPLIAEAFTGRRVTMLSGILVREAEEVLRVVSEGGGTREFGPYVRKVTLRVGEPGPSRPSADAGTSATGLRGGPP